MESGYRRLACGGEVGASPDGHEAAVAVVETASDCRLAPHDGETRACNYGLPGIANDDGQKGGPENCLTHRIRCRNRNRKN
jgi:hypothetical protein